MNQDIQNAITELIPGWADSDVLGLIKLGLFDSDFYLSQNPDVAAAGTDPLLHFLEYGWKEGRRPSAKVVQTEMDFLINMIGLINNPYRIFELNHNPPALS